MFSRAETLLRSVVTHVPEGRAPCSRRAHTMFRGIEYMFRAVDGRFL
jgi:hypothetical protein